MSKWRYTLKAGKELREAIIAEDTEGTLKALGKAWEEIHAQFPDEYDECDLTNDLDNIEMVETEDNDEINYLLDELYDYCDNTRIWVAFD